MLIDCDTCTAPAGACAGCVMTVLLRGPAGVRDAAPRAAPVAPGVEIDDAERTAIGVLAGAGLLPPLRLVRGVSARGAGVTDGTSGAWRSVDVAEGA